MGTVKHKSSDINDEAANNTTDWPITLNNEATPDTTIFYFAAPTVTAVATTATATAISPDAHFPSSGIKVDTELFS